jgi:alanine racemase/tRNA threonylcarbamoyladenosine biosynthesis protein TsaE
MTEQRIVPTAAGMRELGREIGALLRAGDLVVLTGPLGAGKTTLTAGIGAALGVRGPITSPTFVLARTHPAPDGRPPLVHVDAYRLRSAAELDDLDLDYDGAVVVVEWGEGLLDGVSESLVEVRIERPAAASGETDDAQEPRTVEVRASGPRWAAGAPLLG